jgi:hypothetical protein
MKLLGDWTWYLPRSLHWLPKLTQASPPRSLHQPALNTTNSQPQARARP